MVMRRVVVLKKNRRFADGYVLILGKLKTRCKEGGYFETEYKVCRTLSEGSAKKLGRPYGKPLKFFPTRDEHGRWDLGIYLSRGPGRTAFHTTYHRLVALSILKTRETPRGRKKAKDKGPGPWPLPLAPSPWPLLLDPLSLAPCPLPLDPCPRPLVPGPLPLAPCPWPLVPGPLSLAPCPWPLVPGPLPLAWAPKVRPTF